MSFVCTQFKWFIISHLFSQFKWRKFLFDPLIGPFQALPLHARMDVGVMAMKKYSDFLKLQHCWSLTIRLFNVICKTLVEVGGSYPFAEMQTMYSTVPADWASNIRTLVGRRSCPFVEMQTMYSTVPADWASNIRTLVGRRSCPFVEMQTMYSTVPADWASNIRTLVGRRSCPFVEMQTMYSTVPADWASNIRTLVGRRSCPFVEMQSVYSTAPPLIT